MNINKFKVTSGKKIKLSDFPTDYSGKFESREEATEILVRNTEKLSELQDKLYAHNKYALLVLFQAPDAAGKDGAVKHVMSGVNPQGTQVFSFKQPSAEELDHDYLWRVNKSLPERGRIGIFNRSYYEEVLVVRVHNLIQGSQLPEEFITPKVWQNRFDQIRNYEKYLTDNGIVVVKFYLNVSKAEQKKRLLKRIEDPSRNWKFSASDLKERKYWDEYQKCYEDLITATGTKNAPWYIVPADKKWFARLFISTVLVESLEKLDIDYPKLDEAQLKNLDSYREQLMAEE